MNSYRYWTTREVAFLRLWYGIVPDATIAAVLKRTSSSVRNEAQIQGLNHTPGKQQFIEMNRRKLEAA